MWPPGLAREELEPAGDVSNPLLGGTFSFSSFFFFFRLYRVSRHHLGYSRGCCTIGATSASRAGARSKAHTRQSVVEPFSFLWVAIFVFLFFPLIFVAEKKKAHICGLEIYGRDIRHMCLAVRSLLGSEGFLFRFGIGLQDLVSEILWAEKSKLASQGPTRECSRAGGQLNSTRLCHTRSGSLTFQ